MLQSLQVVLRQRHAALFDRVGRLVRMRVRRRRLRPALVAHARRQVADRHVDRLLLLELGRQRAQFVRDDVASVRRILAVDAAMMIKVQQCSLENMHEEIVAALARRNESVALLPAEPLDCSFFRRSLQRTGRDRIAAIATRDERSGRRRRHRVVAQPAKNSVQR